MRSASVFIAIICVLLAFTLGTGEAPGSVAEDAPSVLLYRASGGPHRKVYGVVFALWNDGTLVFSEDPTRPGKSLRVATITKAEASRLGAITECLGACDDLVKRGLAVDSGFSAISFQKGGKSTVRLIWDGPPEQLRTFRPADSVERHTAQLFLGVEAVLAASIPPDSAPFEHADQLNDAAYEYTTHDGEWTGSHSK